MQGNMYVYSQHAINNERRQGSSIATKRAIVKALHNRMNATRPQACNITAGTLNESHTIP
jgi:hypothetical protein